MQNIEMQEMSPEFLNCWQAAGNHLNNQVQGGMSWLRAHPHPPVLEHLSFRLGNQLFFVRVEDAEKCVEGPGSLRGLMSIAHECKGHACILAMKRKLIGGAWQADRGGWGLVNAMTGASVDPVMLITDQKIEMTDWELQDFAVQIVRDQINIDGYQLMSWQGNPAVDPAIWFVGKSKKPEWVVVRVVRYPRSEATRPANWDAIAADCAHMSRVGHFASVAVVSADQNFELTDGEPVPIWRGHGNFVRYDGLIGGETRKKI